MAEGQQRLVEPCGAPHQRDVPVTLLQDLQHHADAFAFAQVVVPLAEAVVLLFVGRDPQPARVDVGPGAPS